MHWLGKKVSWWCIGNHPWQSSPKRVTTQVLWCGQLELSRWSMTRKLERTNAMALAVAEGLQRNRQEKTCSKADSARLSWATAV